MDILRSQAGMKLILFLVCLTVYSSNESEVQEPHDWAHSMAEQIKTITDTALFWLWYVSVPLVSAPYWMVFKKYFLLFNSSPGVVKWYDLYMLFTVLEIVAAGLLVAKVYKIPLPLLFYYGFAYDYIRTTLFT